MTGKGVNNFCDNFYNILGITLLNVCLSKWEREDASWCLLWILQKLPPNFSDTSRGRGWPDGCPLVGCRQGGVHESHCEEDGECERHDDQRATELHLAAPSPRHVTSRVTRTAVTTPATRPPRDTGSVTDKWLGFDWADHSSAYFHAATSSEFLFTNNVKCGHGILIRNPETDINQD